MKKTILTVALLAIVACHRKDEGTTGVVALPVEVAQPAEIGRASCRERV